MERQLRVAARRRRRSRGAHARTVVEQHGAVGGDQRQLHDAVRVLVLLGIHVGHGCDSNVHHAVLHHGDARLAEHDVRTVVDRRHRHTHGAADQMTRRRIVAGVRSAVCDTAVPHVGHRNQHLVDAVPVEVAVHGERAEGCVQLEGLSPHHEVVGVVAFHERGVVSHRRTGVSQRHLQAQLPRGCIDVGDLQSPHEQVGVLWHHQRGLSGHGDVDRRRIVHRRDGELHCLHDHVRAAIPGVAMVRHLDDHHHIAVPVQRAQVVQRLQHTAGVLHRTTEARHRLRGRRGHATTHGTHGVGGVQHTQLAAFAHTHHAGTRTAAHHHVGVGGYVDREVRVLLRHRDHPGILALHAPRRPCHLHSTQA